MYLKNRSNCDLDYNGQIFKIALIFENCFQL